MTHIRSMLASAYARLSAMKLYAYRALDYVCAATAEDRRYLLFCAVQKARVSTEGTKVMSLLSECVGAKGFEADTFFEMALRDAQLIPGLEGSTHINLGLTAQFIPRYFTEPLAHLPVPPALDEAHERKRENPYLMEAHAGAIASIGFPPFLEAYQRLRNIPNVRRFARQAKNFSLFLEDGRLERALGEGTEVSLSLGQCQATITYGQLIAENCVRLAVPRPMVSAIYHSLVSELSISALALASSPRIDAAGKRLIRNVMAIPHMTVSEWEDVAQRATVV